MAVTLGVIAEDNSDVEVIRKLVSRLSNKRIKIKKFTGQGCGKIIGKCRRWTESLRDMGCTRMILMHDLDLKNLKNLRAAIEEALKPSPILKSIVVIPVKEIEAWLLADHDAITKLFSLKTPISKIANPESESRAKEKLASLVYRHSARKTTYLNSVHNERLAEFISLETVGLRCPSFVPLRDFIKNDL